MKSSYSVVLCLTGFFLWTHLNYKSCLGKMIDYLFRNSCCVLTEYSLKALENMQGHRISYFFLLSIFLKGF